ncbi:MAG: macro domain-containing protein, partial [Cyanobacteriota bacterium]
GKSQIEDIKIGLKALIEEVKQLGIRSIAVPPLGCGNGGLDWVHIKPLIESAFTELPDVQVLLFTPDSAPAADSMPIATEKPRMTRARALLISLLELYGIPGYRLSLLEIQKLAYFLQVDGEPLQLRYVKYKYGPYADNLHHALQRLEGHYIRGYGDRKQQAQIYLLPGAKEAANALLANAPEAGERLERVRRLIEGFETPYGMELLATEHWVAQEDPRAATHPEHAVTGVHEWSERKRQLFKPAHIRKAWQRLHEQNWLASAKSQ